MSQSMHEPVVVVAGPYRSGTSCVAGILHHLGYCLGDQLLRPGKDNPTGFFEPALLHKYLRKCFDEKNSKCLVPEEDLIRAIRRWHEPLRDSHNLLALKLPLLCLMMEETDTALDSNIKWIAVDRRPEESAQSLIDSNWWLGRRARMEDALQVICRLRHARDYFLATRNCLRVDYSDLIDDPHSQIETICDYLDLDVSNQSKTAALDFVSPSLKHH